MDFYTELIASIKQMIEEKQFDEARKRINEELAMYYVPGAVEENLLSLLDEIDALSPIKDENLSIEEVIAYLDLDREHQIIAANYFDRLNIREYLDVIETFFLNPKGDDEVKTMLVATLIDQEVNEEIKLTKAGIDYSFIPRYVMRVEESDGYITAKEHFDEVFFKNPSFYNLALELFTKEAYHSLPVNIESDEAMIIAHNIVCHIYRLFDDEDGLNQYELSYGNDEQIVH